MVYKHYRSQVSLKCGKNIQDKITEINEKYDTELFSECVPSKESGFVIYSNDRIKWVEEYYEINELMSYLRDLGQSEIVENSFSFIRIGMGHENPYDDIEELCNNYHMNRLSISMDIRE